MFGFAARMLVPCRRDEHEIGEDHSVIGRLRRRILQQGDIQLVESQQATRLFGKRNVNDPG